MRKLSIEKFRISKLNNPGLIRGGGGDDDGTDLDPNRPNCIKITTIMSKKPGIQNAGGN